MVKLHTKRTTPLGQASQLGAEAEHLFERRVGMNYFLVCLALDTLNKATLH